MSDRITTALLDDLEINADLFDNPSIKHVFLGELLDRRADMIEALIEHGGDEIRFKIQMIDEVIDIREEILDELKSRKGNEE